MKGRVQRQSRFPVTKLKMTHVEEAGYTWNENKPSLDCVNRTVSWEVKHFDDGGTLTPGCSPMIPLLSLVSKLNKTEIIKIKVISRISILRNIE